MNFEKSNIYFQVYLKITSSDINIFKIQELYFSEYLRNIGITFYKI